MRMARRKSSATKGTGVTPWFFGGFSQFLMLQNFSDDPYHGNPSGFARLRHKRWETEERNRANQATRSLGSIEHVPAFGRSKRSRPLLAAANLFQSID
jgi:hypothetical protein